MINKLRPKKITIEGLEIRENRDHISIISDIINSMLLKQAKNNILTMKSIYLLTGLFLFSINVFSQDSSRRKDVNITSTFKPVLKDAAKINFAAAPPSSDTSRPRLNYNIPNQNLMLV